MSNNKIPDLRVREEALDHTRSFIVQAPAGSGKTELLMMRFLNLLTKVEKPEQILAITFTRKAVGEMRTRIMEALDRARSVPLSDRPHDMKRHKLAQTVLERDSLLKWNLLENPGRLKIQTIDSLCASFTKQMPLLSRLGREPSISDTPEELYREAARRTISMVETNDSSGECVRQALRHFDNSVRALEESLITILERRDQWLRHIKPEMDRNNLRTMLEGSIKSVIDSALKKARETFPEPLMKKLAPTARYAASNLQKKGKANILEGLIEMVEFPGIRSDDLPLWQGISELLITRTNNWRSTRGINSSIGFPADRSEVAVVNKHSFKEILESLSGNRDLLKALIVVRQLPKPEYREEEWGMLNVLLHLLPIADRHLKDVFTEAGTADFQTVAMAAHKALGTENNPTDLMLSLDLKIQHILVDEYQDTSRIQLELLKALTRGWEPEDGRTLFIVGDPMQSIYLFREAEVGLFLAAKENNIGNVKLNLLTLTSNFRSQANLINWVNDSFHNAFPEREDPFMGAIRYIPFSVVNPPLDGLKVEIHLFKGRDDAREAREILKIVRSIDNSDSVAILARSRAHVREIVEELKREGIDFRSEEIDPLINRPVTQDLLALSKALLHPYDRTAWLAILRAPWCGLTLSDIQRFCLGDKESPVWSLINNKERISSITRDGQGRVLHFTEKVKKALTMRGRVSPRSTIEGLWIDLGGPACIEDDSMEDACLFFEMVDAVSTAGRIESINALQSRIEELYATHRGTGRNPVEIMTIHKSKGLEFDHVILPGLGKGIRGTDKKILLWMERGEDLLLAPIEKRKGNSDSPIYNYLWAISKEKEILEQTRLFYVATTRARKQLYLFGHIKEIESDTVKLEPRSLLSTIIHRLRPDMTVDASQDTFEGKVVNNMNIPLRLKRLPSAWRSPALIETIPVVVERSDISSLTREPVFQWAGEAVRHLGTALHSYLNRIAREGLSKWDRERVTGERETIAAMLRHLGLNSDEVQKGADRGIDILSRTLKDDRGRWILDEHPGASSELPVTGVVDGKTVHAIIDRTFVDGDICWIIDYKISIHEGGSLEAFLERERERYRKQLDTYAAILEGGGEKRKIRKGLYYPTLSGWIEW
jgi:ATP-dependent exoDNAse (exonuclease V) beta subunit